MIEKCVRKVGVFNGQYKVTIPKSIAQVMELNHKDKLEFTFEEDKFIVRKVEVD